MAKLFLLLICANLNYCTDSRIEFRNPDLEDEVNGFLKDLKESKLEIVSVVFETTKKEDSVFIYMSNSYPNIQRIKAYAKHKGVYFCFGGDIEAKEYYEIINPEPVPTHFKEAYEERRKKMMTVFNEPFTKYLTFYRGKLVESVVENKE
jgi:hypothetical protein